MKETIKQYLNDWPVRLMTMCLLYISGFLLLFNLNGAFAYYVRRRIPFIWRLQNTDFLVISLLAVIFFGSAFTYSLWQKAGGKEGKFIRMLARMDYPFLVIVILYLLYSQFWMVQSAWYGADSLIAATMVCFLALAVLWELTLRYVRRQTLKGACLLPGFLKLYPLTTGIGSGMCLLLAVIAGLCLLSVREMQFFRGGLVLLLAAGAFEGVRMLVAAKELEAMIQDMSTGKAVTAEDYGLSGMGHLGMKLERMSASYESALKESIQAERFKTELITNVSHDIRTPLTSIINYINLLQNLKIEDGDFKAYTSTLERKALRLKVLIDDLLEASKAGSGSIEISREALNLNELAGQVYGEFEEQLLARNLSVIIRHPKEPIGVLADGRYLFRIIENLFGNCVKYSLQGTRIYSEMEVAGEQVQLSLKNISAAPLDVSGTDLMKQFIRGDKSRKTQGNGLGLYIAKSLAELMGCSLEIFLSGDSFEAVLKLPPDRQE